MINWSAFFKMRSFAFLYLILAALSSVAQEDITALEYFIDTDPGIGNGTAVSITPGQTVVESFSIATDALSPGYHILGIRTRNAQNRWSMYERRLFLIQDPTDNLNFPRSVANIAAAEYFIDDDPGPGAGTAISTAGGTTITESISINTDALSPGYHLLGVRTQNTEGRWSMYERRLFLIQDPTDNLNFPRSVANITAAEYFIDNDPGPGAGTAISTAGGATITESISINTDALSPGYHLLGVRTQNAEGRWSMYERRLFLIQDPADNLGFPKAISNIIGAEYFIDTDPGDMNGIPITTSGGATINESFTINTDALSPGYHILGVRARNNDNRWSMYERRLFLIQDPNDNLGFPRSTSNISSAEYFIDTDPGVGSGTAISTTGGATIAESVSINTDALSPGYHILGVRTQNNEGRWSMYERRLFFIQDPQDDIGFPSTPSQIDKLEFFVDEDPGPGNGIDIPLDMPVDVLDLIDLMLNVDSGLTPGTHTFAIRAKNQDGHWGFVETTTFELTNASTPLIASDATDPTNNSVVNVDVSFGQEMTGFEEADIVTLVDDVATGSSLVRNASLTDNSNGDFSLILDLVDEGEIGVLIPENAALATSDATPSLASDTLRFIYDTTSPTVSVNLVTTSEMSPELTGTIDDLSATVDIEIDGNTYAATINPDNTWAVAQGAVSNLAIGTYDVLATATDPAGNVGTDATADEINIVAPSSPIPVIAYSGNSTNNQSPWTLTVDFGVVVSGFDETDIITLLNDNTGTSYVQNGSLIDNADGSFDFVIEPVEGEIGVLIPDAAATASSDGGVSLASDTLRIVYDITAPVASVNALSTTELSPELTGNIDDLSATVDIEIDGNVYSATINPDNTWTVAQGVISSLAIGTYDVLATATDPAGNVGTDATTNELEITESLSGINVVDSLALVAMYNALGGDNWTDNTNWLQTGQDVETWFGIIVSDNRVVDIDLVSNNLTGSIPTEIGDLTALQNLRLNDNNLNGSIPATIGNLTNLSVLNLLLNDLSGSIPSEIGNMTNLSALRLGSGFSGELPAELGNLSNLAEILIVDSEITGSIPAEFGNLTNLSIMYLHQNQLSGSIPSELGNLGNLRILFLHDNILDGSVPPEIGNLSNLEDLRLQGNQLSGSLPAELGNLTQLEDLWLQENSFSGDVPESLINLTLLQNLYLFNNQLNSIPDLSSLSTLNDYWVYDNNLNFSHIEPNVGLPGFEYTPQNTVIPLQITINQNEAFSAADTTVRAESELSISVDQGLAPSNVYQWNLNGETLTNETTSSINISSLSRSNIGVYELTLSNSIANELTLMSDPIELRVSAVISVSANEDGSPILENVNGYLFPLSQVQVAEENLPDTVRFNDVAGLRNVSSSFDFPEVLLGDYLIAVESVEPFRNNDGTQIEGAYLPTFFGDKLLSIDGDTLFLQADSSISITMEKFPVEVETGEGVVSGTIEEDFAEESSRIDARRRAKQRKCGLRRRRTGGRIGEDDDEFELIAYGETNDSGEFEYGFLPQGTYRFFVEYPGIPLDESAFVEFEIGEAGVSDTEFVLAVFASPEGITIEIVLGITTDYFVDFSIYPNPTSDILNISYAEIKLEDVSMEIANIEGRILYSRKLNRSEKSISYDTSLLKPGQYFVRFSGGGNEEPLVYRIIKK